MKARRFSHGRKWLVLVTTVLLLAWNNIQQSSIPLSMEYRIESISPIHNSTVILDPFSLKNGSQKQNIWDLLQDYAVDVSNSAQDFFYHSAKESWESVVCGTGPGRGIEQDAGYKLLTEKIQVYTTRTSEEKLLCLVYTHSPMRYLLRSQALTWGRHCDGFLAFSNETIPSLGIYDLSSVCGVVHEEAYSNMWQKTRKIWKCVHERFLQDFDYFYLAGDDVYLLVSNLRSFLYGLNHQNKPKHFGLWLPRRSMIAGGPGYLLNKAGLDLYIQEAWSHCLVHRKESYEDRFLSLCFSQFLGIQGNATDTRNALGEQRFHDADPASIYLTTSRGTSYFSRLMQSWEAELLPESSDQVGPREELMAAASDSISLHTIFTPLYMVRIHAILHLDLCPPKSPLGLAQTKKESSSL